MRDIDISISTVSRSGDYLKNTLHSIGSERPLKLVAGSLPNSYLDNYRQCNYYTIIDVAKEEWDVIRSKSIWHRASWNYWRCLICDIRYRNGIVIFEDDIQVTRNWRIRLEKTINAIEKTYGQEFILAMYSPYRCDGYKEGLLFEEYIANKFFGTQGMYFSEKTRSDFASYIYQFGVESYHMPYDLLLQQYIVVTGTHLFSTTPSLVQHVGTKTTGLDKLGRFHQAPSFLEEVS